MFYATIESQESTKKYMLDFYNEFMKKEKSKAQFFNSLDEFKKNEAYLGLPEDEKNHFNQYNGKKVIVLVFDDLDQAIKFIEQAQLKGFIKKDQAEAAILQLSDDNQRSTRFSM